MKINQVEAEVGITKKNIRFYEEKGLLSPNRDSENGYRDYSIQDISALKKVKLFRKIGIPIDEIRKLQSGVLSVEDCMRRHIILLEREQSNISQLQELCREMQSAESRYEEVNAEMWLSKTENKEKEGILFLDVKKRDTSKKKKTATIISASVALGSLILFSCIMFWALIAESMPILPFLLMEGTAIVLIVGILLAVISRWKEIEGGEEDEASKY